jgi:Zn-finger nucleic acid-binding protein
MHEIICPSCNSKMKKNREPDITIEVCTNCNGKFLDKYELNILATEMAGDIEFCSIDSEEHNDTFPVRKCPKCTHVDMKKINLLAFSDLIFDFCPRCEGFFLDNGEVNKMNRELTALTSDKIPHEFRGYRDERLVTINRVSNVFIYSYGPVDLLRGVLFLNFSVYFKKPLDCCMYLSKEKIMVKLSKIFDLYKGQDIITDNKNFDSRFLIQGEDERRIKELLSEKTQKEILNFLNNEPSSGMRTFFINDYKINYNVGPYSENYSFGDLTSTYHNTISGLLKISEAFSA